MIDRFATWEPRSVTVWMPIFCSIASVNAVTATGCDRQVLFPLARRDDDLFEHFARVGRSSGGCRGCCAWRRRALQASRLLLRPRLAPLLLRPRFRRRRGLARRARQENDRECDHRRSTERARLIHVSPVWNSLSTDRPRQFSSAYRPRGPARRRAGAGWRFPHLGQHHGLDHAILEALLSQLEGREVLGHTLAQENDGQFLPDPLAPGLRRQCVALEDEVRLVDRDGPETRR